MGGCVRALLEMFGSQDDVEIVAIADVDLCRLGSVVDAGLHGRTVIVESGPTNQLPYAENMVDVFIAPRSETRLSLDDVL